MSEYFDFNTGAVRSEFNKEYVSLFDGWLGADNLHRIDQVREEDWLRFNRLLRLLDQDFTLFSIDQFSGSLQPVMQIEDILCSHAASQDKDSSQFTRLVISELEAIYTEDWDYTWILWHQDQGAVEVLTPLIQQAGLFHWSD